MTHLHGLRAGGYRHPRNPFDRTLAAQSGLERLTLVTQDPVLAQFAVATLW